MSSASNTLKKNNTPESPTGSLLVVNLRGLVNTRASGKDNFGTALDCKEV